MRYFPRELVSESPAQEPAAQVFWEEVCCPLCGAGRYRPLLESPDVQGGTGMWFAVVQCENCGLCYTNPRPAQSSQAQFYPPDYSCHQLRCEARGTSLFRRTRSRLRRWQPPFAWHGDGRLLDFGCGAGRFLTRMKEHHWQVTGIDLSATAVERARQASGARVLAGTLPHADLDPNSFDVITMWHSLEHVPDPMRVLQEARRLLTWNGMLVIAVPNLAGLAFRIFGSHWHGLDLPRHLTHFTPWTLRLMLERSGFRVQSLRMERQSGWIRRSASYACRDAQAPPLHRWLRSKLLSRLVAAYAQLTRQCDAIVVTATPMERG
jgi:SAM-dependent methyltransferase